MSCLECGFKFDPDNESQVVCPACGADPNSPVRRDDDAKLAAAFEDAAAFAETPMSLVELLTGDAPLEPEIVYAPDPGLDFVIADGAALREALTEGSVLVAGNKLIN